MTKSFLFFFLFFLFFLSCTNDSSVQQYKNKKKQEFNLFVTNINYRDYNYENWLKINDLFNSFSKQIELLKNIKEIENEYNKVINQIDNIEKCSFSHQIEFNIIPFNAHISYAKTPEYEKKTAIIDNYKELNELFDNYQIVYDGWNDKSSLEEFNNDYFNDRLLIIYINKYTGSNVNRFVDDVYKTDDSVILHLSCISESNSINDDWFYLTFFIEVDRKELNGINSVYAIEQYFIESESE